MRVGSTVAAARAAAQNEAVAALVAKYKSAGGSPAAPAPARQPEAPPVATAPARQPKAPTATPRRQT